MKSKANPSLKKLTILITVVSLLLSCQKETIAPTVEEQQETNLSIKRVYRQEIEQNNTLNKELTTVQQKFYEWKNTPSTSKIVHDSLYDITIDTHMAIYIETDSTHTYTFPTIQGIDENIVNVLFTMNSDGEYDAFLVTYGFNKEQMETLSAEELSLQTTMEPIELDISSLVDKMHSEYICVYYYEEVCSQGWFGGNGGNLIDDEGCGWVLIADHCEVVNSFDGGGAEYDYNNGTATVTTGGSMTNSGGGGIPSSPTPPSTPYEGEELMKLITVKEELQLNLPQKQWVDQHGSTAFEIHDFLAENMFSEESKVFGKDGIVASINGYNVVNFFPMIKYPPNSNYENIYPELTEYLKNELPKIANNQTIVNAIHDITETPKEIIREALRWGNGPEIWISDLDGEKYGAYRGHLYPADKNKLFLDEGLVNDIENLENSQEFRNEMGFLIAVTILHEYVHLGDNIFGDNYWGTLFDESWDLEDEAGLIFEETVFGQHVWKSNAGIVLRNFGGW